MQTVAHLYVFPRRACPSGREVNQAIGIGGVLGGVKDVFQHRVPVHQARPMDPSQQTTQFLEHSRGVVPSVHLPRSLVSLGQKTKILCAGNGPRGYDAGEIQPRFSQQTSRPGEHVVGHGQFTPLEANVLGCFSFDACGAAQKMKPMMRPAGHPDLDMNVETAFQRAGGNQWFAPPKRRRIAAR